MDDNTPRGEGGRIDSARDTIRAKAADLASNAKEQASRQFDAKVGAATSELSSVASALRRAGDELRSQNNGGIGATVISLIADRLETVGGSIGGRDLSTTLDDIHRMARRNPAAFMGTAAALGFLAARFFKSSSPSSMSMHDGELGNSPDYELYRGPGDFGSRGYGAGYGGGMGSTGYGSGAGSTGYGSGAGSSGFGGTGYGSGSSADAGTSATGWDAPSPAGSGLTGTAEGIQTPPSGTTGRGTKGGSGSGSEGL